MHEKEIKAIKAMTVPTIDKTSPAVRSGSLLVFLPIADNTIPTMPAATAIKEKITGKITAILYELLAPEKFQLLEASMAEQEHTPQEIIEIIIRTMLATPQIVEIRPFVCAAGSFMI